LSNLSSNVVAVVDGQNRADLPCQACNPVQQNVARQPDGLPCDASDHSGTM